MTKLTLRAPAKINLYLRLVGKRRDGFNDLVTVYHRLALSDLLAFKRVRSGCKIVCSHPEVPTNQSNLIYKAYKLLRQEGLRGGVEGRLEKHIPIKAGLGGASSDAATTLIGLNRFYNMGLSKEKLYRLGAKIGSDVPFFLTGEKLALGLDRGEKIVPLNTINTAKFHFALFVFPEGLSTQKVYQNFRYPKQAVNLTNIFHEAIMLPHFFRGRDLSAIAKISYNDLLEPASRLKPEIFALVKRLRKKGAPMVQMSGSGATVFAMFLKKQDVLRFIRRFSQEEKCFVLTTHSA